MLSHPNQDKLLRDCLVEQECSLGAKRVMIQVQHKDG